ncbi:MAG TPA: sialidase [Vicinamibacteria bacterium]
MNVNRFGARVFATILIAASSAATALAQPSPSPEDSDAAPPALRFRYMGPASAGRISAVAGTAGNTATYYAGAASGGVWKTTDSGKTFEPVFDAQRVQAIGALAVAPSDASVVWAGTGEAWVIRPSDVMGDGIYRSDDAGKTWVHKGLTETGRIGRVIVHPTNPDVVYACALGRATGPQPERGVYRTKDRGATWQRVLFVDEDTGCSGLAMDARNPDVLLAGTWQVVMHTWGMFSGGPGSGVYLSKDGGSTWKKLEAGLPTPPVGKVDVAIAPTNSRRMYALIQTASQGSLWRSDDGGEKWQAVSWDRTLIGRAGYYIRLGVSPADENEVLVASSTLHRSTDGGRTFTDLRGGCGDCHDVWWDPANPDHFVVTGDGGMGITTTHGRGYTSVALPIGQMYHVAADDRVPYWIYSNRQDDGTMRGPSDTPVSVPNVPSYSERRPQRPSGGGGDEAEGGSAGGPGARPSGGAAPPSAGGAGFGGSAGAATPWQQGIGGCESGFTMPDPSDPDVVWATCYGNEVTRYDARLQNARSVSPWIHTLDSEPTKVKYRCHWTPPLAVDPFDQGTVYYGCQVLFRTSNGGQSWEVISPDLSTRDPSRIVSSGGVVGDNLGQFYGEVVYAIAPSPVRKGLIWAGTNDGKIWYTEDGGKSWKDVTGNVAGMKEWGTIAKIEPSSFDPATAYVVVDYHLMDARDPFIYKTSDLGRTWKRISDGLPHGHPLDYALAVAENPNRRGMLLAGTGRGFHYSLDDGATWMQFKEGLPAAPVTWALVQKRHHDVVVSTYGRGLYILSDITPLEQSDQAAADAPAHLFSPRPGFRLARSGRAEITYRLKSAGAVQLEILDASGAVVRVLKAKGRAGLNRTSWDLRHEGPKAVELRTVAPDNPFIWAEPRFKGKDTRPVIHWGIQNPQRLGPLAAPGGYSVRLKVDGASWTRPLEVLKDPRLPSSDADLALSTKTQVRIRDDIDAAAGMINRIEVLRKQVEDRARADDAAAEVRQALVDLDKKALEVELMLLSRTELHSDDKWYVEAYKAYLNLLWLSGVVGTGAGDVAGGADHRPTDSALAVLETIEGDLAAAKAAYARLMEQELPAFNAAMAVRGAPPLGVTTTP